MWDEVSPSQRHSVPLQGLQPLTWLFLQQHGGWCLKPPFGCQILRQNSQSCWWGSVGWIMLLAASVQHLVERGHVLGDQLKELEVPSKSVKKLTAGMCKAAVVENMGTETYGRLEEPSHHFLLSKSQEARQDKQQPNPRKTGFKCCSLHTSIYRWQLIRRPNTTLIKHTGLERSLPHRDAAASAEEKEGG